MATNRMGLREELVSSIAPGINNRLKGHQLAVSEGVRFVQGAENVDINAAGKPQRRAGKTLLDAANFHSLWSDERDAFAVRDDVLSRIVVSPDGTDATFEPLLSLAGGYPVSYTRASDGSVYFSNALTIARIDAAGALRAVATPAPPVPPVITVGAAGSGGLLEGLYLVASTHVSIDGESPATLVQQVQVPANGSLTLTAPDASCFYVSGPNGDVLTLQLENTTGGLLVNVNESGRLCRMLHKAVMPPGELIHYHEGIGRLLVALDNVLGVSDPYNFGIIDPREAFFPFPSPITMLASVESALYVGTKEATYVVTGDLFSQALSKPKPYGALRGTAQRSPNQMAVYWQSQQGLCVGDGAGQVTNLQEKALVFGPAGGGATLFRERDGMTHVVATRSGVQPSITQASSFMEARIVRKGTPL